MPPSARAAVRAAQLDRALGDWQRPDAGPAYRALAGGLRTLVLDGRVPVETRLPAERELSTALGVSRTTVAAAYELLRDEGFLTSRRGAGSWTSLPAGRAMPVIGISPHAASGGPGGGVPGGGLPGRGDVIDLGIAAMSAPEPWLSRAMAAAVAELPAWTATHGDFPAGLTATRQAVADRYTARGLPTGPEQIMITTGAAGAFSLLLRHVLAPGERVAVESPSFANVLQALRYAGGRAVPVPLLHDGWDLEAWARTLRDAAPRMAYLIPDFHNPTGLLMPEAERRSLVDAARATGTLLVSDETMVDLCLDQELAARMPRPLAAFDHGGTVVTLGSAGKTFWGGLRIGWIRATPELIRRLAGDRASLDVSSPVVEQLAVRHLLAPQTLPQILTHQRDRVRAQRDALAEAVRELLPGWTFRLPQGGLSLWVRTAPGLSGSALATTAERHGVWVGSGPRFGVDGVLERFVRLPFSLPPEVSREAVRRLAAAAASLSGAEPATTPPAEVTLL
ncbi:DNA-binding transcriptional MocR family regulator [Streptacidiphilus sp. MAP12-33]|uniref:MocR-like transcription factor YczR n=1 Tax=Streptacidiphilus sp. MAP12-33 TaxID=3156266 RepID=UPI0035192691